MSDQTPPDQASPTNEQESVDLSARLASLGAARPGVTSIWQRREAAPPATVPTVDSPDIVAHPVQADAPPPPATAPRAPMPPQTPPSPTTGGIGRLTRVSAAELWTEASAMSSWVAANADALSELTGVEGLRFHAPTAGTVLGKAADGSAVCVVCEVGPSSDEGLGSLLRTAAVQDGGIVVWLTGGASDSHVAALSWLNRATAPRFFLAKATGVRIDGSASAPLFENLVRPPRATEAAEETAGAPQRRVEDHVPEG